MKKENKFIYYGILFYVVYTQIYVIISSVLISPFLILKWNIYVILTLLILPITLLSVMFYRIKKFPRIRLWFILLLIFLSTMLNFFEIPHILYLSSADSLYSLKEQYAIFDYILTCKAVNIIVFIVIAYYKYFRIQRDENREQI